MKNILEPIGLGVRQLLAVLISVLCLSCLSIATPGYAQQQIRLGVLAKRGYQTALKRWHPLVQYLSKRLGTTVVLVPLNFSQVPEYVGSDKVDLILANQKFYVSLRKRFGIRALATVINSRGGPYMGGVIFTRKTNPVRNLNQLRGKHIGIVSFGSCGGFLIQAYDLLQKGINIIRDSQIKPLEGQDYVVYAVLNGAVDVGFVRTGQLESMAREKKVQLKAFRIISPQEHANFPLLCSTSQLWPAWPVAATNSLPDNLAMKIQKALLALPSGSKAATAARIRGFAPPGDYGPVAQALSAIKKN